MNHPLSDLALIFLKRPTLTQIYKAQVPHPESAPGWLALCFKSWYFLFVFCFLKLLLVTHIFRNQYMERLALGFQFVCISGGNGNKFLSGCGQPRL